MVITVQCPECATSFPVDPAKVPLGGVKARCSSCSAIFRVERPDEALQPTPAPTHPVPEPGEGPPFPEDLEAVEPPAEDAPDHDVPSVGLDESSEEVGWDGQATVSVETAEAPAEPSVPESPDAWIFETEEDIDPDSLQIEPVGTLEESLENAKDEVLSFGSDLTAEPGVEVVDTDEGPGARFTFEETDEELTAADEAEGFLGSSGQAATESRSAFDMDFVPSLEAEIVEPEPAEEVMEPEPVEEVVEPEPVSESWEPEGLEEILAEPVSEATSPPDDAPWSESGATSPPVSEPGPGAAVTGFTFGRRDPHDKARRLARVLVSDIITYNPDRHRRALSAGSLKEDFEEEIEKSWKEYVEQVGPDIARNTPYWSQALNDVLAKGQQVF
jgi:predicted Zn finger-like uncharacterized protein